MRSSILFLAVFAAACGVNESTVGQNDGTDDLLADDAELSATSRTYVAVRRDFRKCIAPLCGGYWVHDLNRVTLNEVYVSGLDFSASGLSEIEQGQVQAGLGEVVLRGKLGPKEAQWNTRTFIVSEAYRGLPGKAFDGEKVFKAKSVSIQCFRAPCPSLGATRVNYTAQTLFHGFETTRFAQGHIDTKYFTSRIVEDGALVAGSWVRKGEELKLDVANVFLRLPANAPVCPLFFPAPCPSSGQVRTFKRVDGCEVPSICVSPGACTKELAVCNEGYTLQSWPSAPYGCNAYACDPNWLLGVE